MTNEDRKEIMHLLNELKKELRAEIWEASNRNHDDKNGIKSDVSDNTEAILELSELIPQEV